MSQELSSNTSSQYALQSTDDESEKKVDYDWTEMIALLDHVCCKVSERYDLYLGGQPRKAMITEIISRNACIACIDKQLRTRNSQRIDSMYGELHQLSCNLLVEELYCRLVKSGHKVSIATEADLKFGKADIFIVPCYYGLSLYTNRKEIVVEVKSGFGLSIPQLLRYLIDKNPRAIVLWRIRNEQTVVLEKSKITPLLTQFIKMVVSRADRLLLASDVHCNHNDRSKAWSPNSQQIQQTFSDFANAVVRTLPHAVEAIMAILDEEETSSVEDCKTPP